MHPVAGELLAVGRLALCDLVLMMREDKVLAACMDVDLLAQIFFGHLRTLDMPSRTAFAPRGLPCRLALFLRLPEHEIKGIFLFILPGHKKGASAGLQVIQVLVGKLAVILELPGAVVNRSVLLIGIAFIDQCPDHVHHAADLLRCQGILCRRFDVHGIHVFFAFLDVAFGDHLCGRAFLDRLFDDLIIHIREI